MFVIKVRIRLHIAANEISITFSHFYVIIYNDFLAYHETFYLRIAFLNSILCLPNLHKMQKLPAAFLY